MDTVYLLEDISEMLMPVFSSYHIKKAILFDSYSKGIASDNSDIDLLVESGQKGLSFVGLIEDIRRAVGKEVDVLDITHIENNSSIEKEIQDSGVLVYEG